MNWLRDRILRWARARQPDFVIGGQQDPYLRRHWLLPRNSFFNVYVHEFLRSDDDRAHHDHPYLFNASWLIQGEYVEHTIAAGGIHLQTMRQAGALKFRWGASPHRIELIGRYRRGQGIRMLPCWTVFVTGPRVREWGFLCRTGWVHWQQFTSASDAGSVGRGCE